MSRSRSLTIRFAATAVSAAVLAGCGATDGRAAVAGGAAPSPAAPAPSAAPTPWPTTSPSPAPSLPPGAPGLDASGVPSPDASAPKGHRDDHGRATGEPRAEVPDEAMVGAETVAAMLGGSWSADDADAVRCTAPGQAAGRRTVSYRAAEAELRQTVSTHADAATADAAVAALADRLAGCGWRLGPDPRMGTVSLAASHGDRRLTVVAADGVSVALVGGGRPLRDEIAWGSLVDVALGTSCAAAPDGCH